MAAAIRNLLLLTIIAITVFCADGYGVYQLVWSDEFDGTTLNTSNWSYDIGNGSGGWGNNELEYYRSQNVSVSGGYLIIEARQEAYGGCSFTSGKIKSINKQDFLYGKIEARMKVPTGGGMWPAFWMMPTDSVYGGWAASGEIDIMETCNATDFIGGTIHYGGSWPNNVHSGGTLRGANYSAAFHVYTLEWTPTVMRWYVDGLLYSVKTSWYSTGGAFPAPFDQYFYIIMNVAVGGNYTGCTSPSCITASLPQQLQVDWVRVYQDISDTTVLITNPTNEAFVPAGDIIIQAIASDGDGSVSKVEFYGDANKLGEDTTSPYSFTWTSVPNGCHTIMAKVIDNAGGSATNTINITVGTGCGQSPYHGSPSAIPGKIQAEDFDYGGEGVAYHDIEAANQGGQYRPTEGVDIQACTDTGGGYNVGWVRTGEWMEYTVNVGIAGTYTIEARVASNAASSGIFHIEFNGVDKTGNINVPVTGGWQNWTTVSATVTLSAGTQIMRFVAGTNDFNINYFNISANMVTVPDVTGLSQASAQSAITAAGLTVGVISQSFSNTVADGNVISQTPGGGTSAPAGSPVDLEISLGIRGDLNVDGTVDIDDVYIMAVEWLSSGVLADIEPVGGNGVVDFLDFAVLASNWGQSIYGP